MNNSGEQQFLAVVGKATRTEAEKIFRDRFSKAKRTMINQFLSLKITSEIMSGPSASNISATLNGRGNLFSFIGFDESDTPITPILQILENNTTYKYVGFKNKKHTFSISLPTSQDIFDATPMPWAIGRSWAKGIETGISGLGMFLAKQGQGRSGGGIQSTKINKKIKFQNQPYISKFINDQIKAFKNI